MDRLFGDGFDGLAGGIALVIEVAAGGALKGQAKSGLDGLAELALQEPSKKQDEVPVSEPRS